MIWGVEGRHIWVPPLRDRRNLVTNPKATVNTAGWSSTGSALTRLNPGNIAGFVNSFQQPLGSGSAGVYAFDSIPVVSGKTYRFSAYVLPNTHVTECRLEIRNAAGVLKANSASLAGGSGSARLDVGVTADATENWTFRIVVISVSTLPGLEFTGALVEEGSALRAFFDGDSDGAYWTGTANASISETIQGRVPTIAEYLAGGLSTLTLNRRSDDAGVKVFPRYKLEKIGGLQGTGESGDRRDVRVRAQGEIPRRSFRRGKTITYEGLTQARTRAELRQAEADLRAGFDDQTAEGLMVVRPHPLYDASGNYRYFPARAIACEIEDEISFSPSRPDTRGHESPFVVAVRNARAGGVDYTDQAGVTYP